MLYPAELLGHIHKISTCMQNLDSNDLPLRRRMLYPAELRRRMTLPGAVRRTAPGIVPIVPVSSPAVNAGGKNRDSAGSGTGSVKKTKLF